MELVGGARVKLVGGILSLLVVVAYCYGNKNVVANCGVLGAILASTFGR